MNENPIPPQKSLKRLLVIDDEENMRHMLKALLSKSGYHVDTAADGIEGLRLQDHTRYDFVLCDIKMPHLDGMEFLTKAREKLLPATVIMMSAYGTVDTALKAIKMGAYDYISKPFKTDEVLLTLKKAEERETLKQENQRLKAQLKNVEEAYNFGKMVSQNKAMQNIFRLATKVAQHGTTVLIIGESGTGKELITRGIHFASKRSKMALVPVNCGGIPENLLESELFGHKKGAFTGADKNKKGLFEVAEGGTLFLDEIGEMPLALQVKLLRVLQENEIRMVGDSQTKKIDVRIIAATSKNLEEEVAQGRFREDLFYRLNVMPLFLPPLRERSADIPLLCRHFIDIFNKKLDMNIKGIAPQAMSYLLAHDWPGNIRELENAIERAVLLAEEPYLTLEYFPQELYKSGKNNDFDDYFNGYSLKAAQIKVEQQLIRKALKKTKGNRTQAANLLEISHPSLLSKMKRYHIDL